MRGTDDGEVKATDSSSCQDNFNIGRQEYRESGEVRVNSTPGAGVRGYPLQFKLAKRNLLL